LTVLIAQAKKHQKLFEDVDGLEMLRSIGMFGLLIWKLQFKDFGEVRPWQFLKTDHSTQQPSHDGCVGVAVPSATNHPLYLLLIVQFLSRGGKGVKQANSVCPCDLGPSHILAGGHRVVIDGIFEPALDLPVGRDFPCVYKDIMIGFFIAVAVDDQIVEHLHPDEASLLEHLVAVDQCNFI
jgi:hypothetical protein